MAALANESDILECNGGWGTFEVLQCYWTIFQSVIEDLNKQRFSFLLKESKWSLVFLRVIIKKVAVLFTDENAEQNFGREMIILLLAFVLNLNEETALWKFQWYMIFLKSFNKYRFFWDMPNLQWRLVIKFEFGLLAMSN